MHPVSFVRTSPEALGEVGDINTYHNPLSLDEYFVKNPTATYFVRVGEDASPNEKHNLLNGDVLVVDRSVSPRIGQIVLVVDDGELLVGRWQELYNNTHAHELWGVVVALVRKMLI